MMKKKKKINKTHTQQGKIKIKVNKRNIHNIKLYRIQFILYGVYDNLLREIVCENIKERKHEK